VKSETEKRKEKREKKREKRKEKREKRKEKENIFEFGEQVKWRKRRR
jgi:hypothetical protein